MIPGGIFLTVGMVCQIAMLYDSWGYMWPGFILAVAVGLFEFYWFGPRNKWLLVPICILAGLSSLFFIVFSIGPFMSYVLGKPLIAGAMILAGLILLMGRFTVRKQ